MNWQTQLISLYVFICKEFQQGLNAHCQRMSNYSNLDFTDEEVMTIFMFGVMNQKKTLKEIYMHAHDYLNDWFPALPTYVAFIQRINRLHEVFVPLIESLQTQLPFSFDEKNFRLMDSMPIIMAQNGRRFKASVARNVACPNGYCATKKMYYYGVKLHVVGCYQKGALPIPELIGLTPAGFHDRKAYEQILPAMEQYCVFADKAYQKEDSPILSEGNIMLYTPVKKEKGQEFLDSADKLLSSAISSIRQPIESFFNWLEEKTKIQIASKVRSYQGLMVHVFGRIAAAFFLLMDRLSS
jgi:hypothetical protein